ncbi:MAG: MAPEG family protein [Lysobacteraceae bacterium]
MTDFTLVYPMFAMVALTATVLVILFRSRVRAVRGGKVNMTYFRTYQGEIEPDETAKPSRHFVNLFEAPTLFYAACITAMIVHDSGIALLALAWVYVVVRTLHTFIHLGGNRIRHRMRAYFASWLVLFAIWVHIVVHVAMG